MNGHTVKVLNEVQVTHATGVPDQCSCTRNGASKSFLLDKDHVTL